ncbi:thioredoxin domain-containing protein [Segnochrobactraceae bacterium EtOH-i3]
MGDNRLGHETSPYLIQHKDNPVDWRPWGPEALAEARATGKPILLSVGYAACHWCHVMAHESFEDPATAALMNRLFVNIKVDREERPDVDQTYMAALHALGLQGGWPLTMFLAPDGAPIWGGTYFPPVRRHGHPAFREVLEAVAASFASEPEKIARNRSALLKALAARPEAPGGEPGPAFLEAAAERLAGLMDPVKGGPRGAPKFPNAGLLEVLWRRSVRAGDDAARELVRVTLEKICRGGIYDHLGGGFARYSVDDLWLVPHFEKMLYDNAQLLRLLTPAHGATGEPLFATRVAETIDFLVRELRTEDGAFAASLDADSEGEEGRFYVWTPSEITATLGPDDAALFCGVYDVTPEGNFEGASILNRLESPPLDDETEARLTQMRRALLAAREARIRPGRDDKVLADWNGLTIRALAEAADAFRRADWLALAEEAYRFLVTTMAEGDRLGHSFRAGRLVFPGFATDQASVGLAALTLSEVTGRADYLADAIRFADALDRDFAAPDGGLFLTDGRIGDLPVRPRAHADEATPGGAGLAAELDARLALVTGAARFARRADTLLAATAPGMARNLFSAASLLNALDTRLAAETLVLIVPAGASAGALKAAAHAAARPGMTVQVLSPDAAAGLAADHPAAGKGAIDGRATAYLCRGATCQAPVTDPAALTALFRPVTEAGAFPWTSAGAGG